MKLLTFNITALTVNFTSVDKILSISLLLLSIGYTVRKWHLMENKNKK